MPLTPDQERELEALVEELTATDPTLARDPSRPGRPARLPLWTELLGLGVLLGWSAVGLAPLALGLALGPPWLAGVGAVTTCGLPFPGLRATFRLFPRFRERLRAIG